MDQKQIINRIADLLKLTGVKDKQTVEELTDHYLTHIEEEIKRGVNTQQAIRETYQEIAHLEFIDLSKEKRKKNKWLFFLLLIAILISFLGIRYDVLGTHKNTTLDQQLFERGQVEHETQPPSGIPLSQSLMDISSDFGLRMHPINKEMVQHKGIDIKAKLGTPVLATGDGEVIDAGFEERPGYFIKLKHNSEFSSRYLHLSEILVEPGSTVKKGEVIGKVGSSGFSFRPHLHYEILKSDVPINPKEYIKP